jgi:hypothetical protein
LKFFQIEIPWINYPKLINIECSSKEGIYLTNLTHQKKKNIFLNSEIIILNISEDTIIYNYIIDNNNSNKKNQII